MNGVNKKYTAKWENGNVKIRRREKKPENIEELPVFYFSSVDQSAYEIKPMQMTVSIEMSCQSDIFPNESIKLTYFVCTELSRDANLLIIMIVMALWCMYFKFFMLGYMYICIYNMYVIFLNVAESVWNLSAMFPSNNKKWLCDEVRFI